VADISAADGVRMHVATVGADHTTIIADGDTAADVHPKESP